MMGGSPEKAAGPADDGQAQILFYDGECVLCNGSVAWTIRFDRRARIRHAALQGATAGRLLGTMTEEQRMAGVVFYDGGTVHQGPEAIARLAGVLFPRLFAWLLPFVRLPVVRTLARWTYAVIARNRYRWFGRYDQCRLPPPELRDRYIVD